LTGADIMATPAPADAARRPAARLGALEDAFERAARACGGACTLAFDIAGRRLRVRLAGEAMRRCLEPALAHLAAAAGGAQPDLEAMVWDTRSTGVELPARERAVPMGAETVWQTGAGILTAVDAERRRAVVWAPDADAVPFNEIAAPLRVFVHLALAHAGMHLVHAAAVGRPDAGALIVGRSGAGKSSTALACLGSGLGVAGDDYVAVAPGEPPHVHSLYSSAKLNPEQLARFPALAAGAANRGRAGEKPVLFLHPRWEAAVVRGFPLRAALAPRIVGRGATSVTRVGRAALLAALAPSTIFQLPGTGGHTLAALARLLAAVPCYELRLGARLADIPPAVERALADASR
jgi:hypothetical protein